MGQFYDYTFTYHITLSNQSLQDRVKQKVSQLGLSYIESNNEKANICIVDASLYYFNRTFYNEKYEVCLKVLYEEEPEKVNKILSDGTNFVLYSVFTDQELKNTISLILEYLTYKSQSQILKTIFDSAQNTLVLTDTKGVIKYANKYFLEATGYENDEILGSLPRLIYSGLHNDIFYKDLWNTILSGNVWNGFFINKRKNGRLFYEEATISPISDTLGQNKNFLKIGKLVEREHLFNQELNQEIKLAQELINYMLPPDYSDDYICFSSRIKAYNYLGGDYVCFEEIGDSKYAMAIIDVVGHSISSALIGLKSISVFQSTIYFDSLEKSVAKVNNAVNRINEEDLSNVRYLSGIFMVIDLKEKSLSYINAGHPAFYAKGQDRLLKFESNNMILGITNHKAFIVESIPLDNISYLFLYSDGLVENKKDQLSKSEYQLEEALSNAEVGNMAFMESVLAEMIGNGEYSDDITLCYIELQKNKEGKRKLP